MGMRKATLVLSSLALLCGGCQHEDATQLAKLGARLGQKVEALLVRGTNRLGQTWPSLPIHFGDATLDGRVAARLRWDRRLAEVPIHVQANGAMVELHGKVRSLEERRRAIELAETTTGVEKVTDKLEGPE